MQLAALIAVIFSSVLAVMINYANWVLIKTRRRLSPAERTSFCRNVKIAYALNGAMIIFVTTVLLYFLFTNILFAFPQTFLKTFMILFALAGIFEVVNYLSYYYFSRSL